MVEGAAAVGDARVAVVAAEAEAEAAGWEVECAVVEVGKRFGDHYWRTAVEAVEEGRSHDLGRTAVVGEGGRIAEERNQVRQVVEGTIVLLGC